MLIRIVQLPAIITVASYLSKGGNLMEIRFILISSKKLRQLLLENDLFWIWYLTKIYTTTSCLLDSCRKANLLGSDSVWLKFCKVGVAQRKLKRQWRLRYSGRIVECKDVLRNQNGFNTLGHFNVIMIVHSLLGQFEIRDLKKINDMLNDLLTITQLSHSLQNLSPTSFEYQNVRTTYGLPRVKQWVPVNIHSYNASSSVALQTSLWERAFPGSGVAIAPQTRSLFIPESVFYNDSMPRHFRSQPSRPSSGPQREMLSILKDMIESVGAELTPSYNSSFNPASWSIARSMQYLLLRVADGLLRRTPNLTQANRKIEHIDPGSERMVENLQQDVLWFATKVRLGDGERFFLAAIRPMEVDTAAEEPTTSPLTPQSHNQSPSSLNNSHSAANGSKGEARRWVSPQLDVLRVSMVSFVPFPPHALEATPEHPLMPIAKLL